MKRDTMNIMIGGEAGQGLVTIGEILTKTLVRSGYSVTVSKSYQSRVRGGHNTFSIRFGPGEIHAPQESVDLLVALNGETVRLHGDELNEGGIVIADREADVECDDCIRVPFKELAENKYNNTAALGVVGAIIGIDKALIRQAVDDRFEAKKGAEVASKNEAAIDSAYEWVKGQSISFEAPKAQEGKELRAAIDGNQAIALGAISAGVRFYSFYPMTPATSVALTLLKHADEAKLVVEQVEDEIAAINMALGASYAGAVSMVGTSGGGFALMVEGISLAGMTETPIVVVVAQRPGPATGLPTRTEQADLDFVLHSGHGEFPRAVFAPGSVEECFSLTRKAVELAERYQSPVFILTDQFLADSTRAVASSAISELRTVRAGASEKEIEGDYLRFRVTDDGVSPRLLPGRSRNLVVVDSDEHTPDGHITEDLKVRVEMVEKRMRKLSGLRAEVTAPEYSGADDPDILLVTWGSTKGAALEATRELEGKGVKCATLSFGQVWPLVADHFMKRFEAAKRVVCVEGNALGQFAGLIRRETGYEMVERILRYDGLPITPEFILGKIEV